MPHRARTRASVLTSLLLLVILSIPVSAGGQVQMKRPPPTAPVVKVSPKIDPRLIPKVQPVVTTLRPLSSPNAPNLIVRAGDMMVVQGTALDDINPTVTVAFAKNIGTPNQANWVPNPDALKTFPATATNITATSFQFAVPDVPPTMSVIATMLVTVSKGTMSATTKETMQVGQKPTERKITSVAQTAVRAGGRIKISGLGFDDVPGPGGYNGVTVGYFGVGTPGSATNPAISVGNRGATYVELWLPQTCDQYGLLMLGAPSMGGGSETYIVATPPIYVGCAKADPSGTIVGSEGLPNNTITVAPTASVTIRGKGLRYVTKIVDQTNLAFPFTFATIGSGPSAFDQLTVPLAPAAVGRNVSFTLLSSLTDPVMGGSVSGLVLVR